MTKPIEPLIAMCVLASVAQAQFCHTAPATDGGKALEFANTEVIAVAEFAADEAGPGNDAKVSLSQDLGRPWFSSGFYEPNSGGTFHPETVAEPPASGLLASSDGSSEIDPASAFTFTPPMFTETTGMASWLVERGTDMRLQGMLDALEPDVRSVIESQESGAGAATATDAKSVPEPTTYGLFGVMVLLGLAVARKSSGP